jgi:anti-sigma regulatory factor (Ser/Thr protein kinase)
MDRIPVTDPSDVAAARRHAAALATTVGQDETDAGRVALIVTELGNNLIRHGGGGEMLFGLDRGTAAGIEMLAIDRGRGMADVAACLRDGYSTAGTPGTGLGAVQRMADEIDIRSRPQGGTIILARVRRKRDPAPDLPRRLAVVTVPKTGETVCGDAAAMVLAEDGRIGLLTADGLGHGELAAAAAHEALRQFRSHRLVDPVTTLEAVHAGLKHTRGAAVAVAIVDPARQVVLYGGIGNIAGILADGNGVRRMVSYNGTAGHGVWKVQAFTYPYAGTPTVVMHSDGLATSWSLEAHAGLLRHDPALIAATLYRDHARGRDDCGVLVWKG